MTGLPRAILGIDAAWTFNNPSGVALLIERAGRWEVGTIAASYKDFLTGTRSDRRHGSKCDVAALISTAEALAHCEVRLVAVDMPLALTPITARRVSDNVVSRLYGGKGCGTHSPSEIRPGKISDNLRTEFEDMGFSLAVQDLHARSLCEVYPHPALLALTGRERRLAYKESKRRNYWPTATPAERVEKLLEVWSEIMSALRRHIGGIDEHLHLPDVNARGYALKAFEDRLDAVVCGWIGACIIAGRAQPYGDTNSTIWIPDPANLIDCATT